jgi:PAS domain S-box-containing protein
MDAAPELTTTPGHRLPCADARARFLNAISDPAWVKDTKRYVVSTRPIESLREPRGRADVPIVGLTDLISFPEDAERAHRSAQRHGGARRHRRQIICSAQGIARRFDIHRVVLLGEAGQVAGTVGFAQDVTEKSEHAARLEDGERMLATLVRNLPGMAYRRLNDAEWTMEFTSEGCSDLTGYPAADFIGSRIRTWSSTIVPEDLERVWREVQEQLGKGGRYASEYRILRADGVLRWVSERGVGVGSGSDAQAVLEGIVTDITDTRYYLEEMVHRATHDTLTGVANRPLLIDHLRHGIAYGQRYQRMVATLVVNIDHFKYVNQSLGHDAGDQFLMETASRLRKALREHDTIARLGADSFAMVLMDLENLGAASQVMTRILSTVREPPN